MEITTRSYGGNRKNPGKIIELIINTGNTIITEDITNLDKTIDESLIQSLKDIVEELEEQNRLIKKINETTIR